MTSSHPLPRLVAALLALPLFAHAQQAGHEAPPAKAAPIETP